MYGRVLDASLSIFAFHLPYAQTIESNSVKQEKNTAKSLFMLSFQKSTNFSAAGSYIVCASRSNFGGAAIEGHIPCFVDTCQENKSWRIQEGRLWSLALE